MNLLYFIYYMLKRNYTPHSCCTVDNKRWHVPVSVFARMFIASTQLKITFFVCFFLCLRLFIQQDKILPYSEVATTGKGLRYLTYTWHLWSLSRESFLAFETTFICLSSWNSVTLTDVSESSVVGFSLTCFNDL